MTLQQLEQELIELPATERLRLARWLLDTLLEANENSVQQSENPLLRIAGRFHGGPGNTAERAEEILSNEVDATYGLGNR
ncbi:MAG: hypothetical protein KDE19_10095 [Caldilineaceae bacterium]|nr:hypothetical protein [Caldilineaceae bacterium]